MNKWKQEGQI